MYYSYDLQAAWWGWFLASSRPSVSAITVRVSTKAGQPHMMANTTFRWRSRASLL